jgi:hypothetical protein
MAKLKYFRTKINQNVIRKNLRAYQTLGMLGTVFPVPSSEKRITKVETTPYLSFCFCFIFELYLRQIPTCCISKTIRRARWQACISTADERYAFIEHNLLSTL